MIPVKKWNELVPNLCNLMYERHPDDFTSKLLGIKGNQFSESPDRGVPIGNSGIYVKVGGGSGAIRQLCSSIAASFGYPEGSLTIEERD